jgi:hypothetical protein
VLAMTLHAHLRGVEEQIWPNNRLQGDALQPALLTSLRLPGAPEAWRWAADRYVKVLQNGIDNES